MKQEVLLLIQEECEKIEMDPGFGNVTISIVNGRVKTVKPSPTIDVDKDLLDRNGKKI
ncbi:hypothetical protein LCGC14_0477180 [marine sediment metagenome]|uniref:Uncharacterized protein n=1 Tax=marine sediment metagenome TaxID=412755 RepID=A0A0F9UXI7_9ZZZZ